MVYSELKHFMWDMVNWYIMIYEIYVVYNAKLDDVLL